jgi:tight adherence protein C
MIDVGFLNILFDLHFDIMAIAGVLAFATVVTLGLPMLDRDTLNKRMKFVAERREELRLRYHADLKKRGARRTEAISFMKQTVERLNLSKILESEGTREKLARAGKRGQAALITFLFFRFVMPFIVFVVSLFYLFVIGGFGWSGFMNFAAAVGLGALGFYLPDVFVSNLIQKRQTSIMRAFPDALDLMLICVESGMSIEAAFQRVAAEIGPQSAELAEELALTTAELSYLQERRMAFENLAKRCGHSGVKAISAALNQSEKYGTPVGQALRAAALENREARIALAEKKAAALPAKLTVPMIVFFLPCLFVVILGPAAIQLMHAFHH